MLESTIQKKILRYLKEHPDVYSFKAITANRKGVPDVIVCYKGKFIGLEVKRPGGKPTKLQEHNIEQIKQSGGYAGIVYDVEDVKTILEEADNE